MTAAWRAVRRWRGAAAGRLASSREARAVERSCLDVGVKGSTGCWSQAMLLHAGRFSSFSMPCSLESERGGGGRGGSGSRRW